MITLGEIADTSNGLISYVSGDRSLKVRTVEYDSRKAMAGSLFVAVSGFALDGHSFVRKAAEQGASAVLVEEGRTDEFSDIGIPILVTKNSRSALSRAAAIVYGNPSQGMAVIGVTGTNGKTSSTYLIEQILKEAGYKPGVIGTIDYRWNDQAIPAPNTTPESADLQYLIRQMADDGVNALVMEVSSHGLALGRVDDISFDGGIFTNLTRDHLDFHQTFEEYFSAKCKLFSLIKTTGKGARFAAVQSDDEYGKRILGDDEFLSLACVSFGYSDSADYRVLPGTVSSRIDGLGFTLSHNGLEYRIELPLAGSFHVYNSLGAFTAMSEFGIDPELIIKGLSKCVSVPGRFDTVHSPLGFSVVVDYAHTDDALRKLLQSVGALDHSKILTVFGCGGDRDKTKRPLMGRAACELSDHVIVTSDNPRTEEPHSIINDILAGIGSFNGRYEVEADREKAIARAIQTANKGDIVVIAGKGHEDYQILGKVKIHFDDRELARKYISERTA